jgi:hypothetical protein
MERIATKRHKRHKREFIFHSFLRILCFFVAIISYPELRLKIGKNNGARMHASRFGQARRFGGRRRLDGGAVRPRIFEGSLKAISKINLSGFEFQFELASHRQKAGSSWNSKHCFRFLR